MAQYTVNYSLSFNGAVSINADNEEQMQARFEERYSDSIKFLVSNSEIDNHELILSEEIIKESEEDLEEDIEQSISFKGALMIVEALRLLKPDLAIDFDESDDRDYYYCDVIDSDGNEILQTGYYMDIASVIGELVENLIPTKKE